MSWPSLVWTLVSHARLAARLLREPGVPLLTKVLPVLAALYVILPVLGQLDDLSVLLVAIRAFLKLSPAGAVGFHRTAMAQGRKYGPMPVVGEVIDAKFRREEDVD